MVQATAKKQELQAPKKPLNRRDQRWLRSHCKQEGDDHREYDVERKNGNGPFQVWLCCVFGIDFKVYYAPGCGRKINGNKPFTPFEYTFLGFEVA